MVMVELSETRRRGGSSRGSRSSRSRSSSGGSSSKPKSSSTHQSKPPQFALRWLSNKLNWVAFKHVQESWKEGIDDHLVDLTTAVKYKNGETKILHGVDKTVSLEDTKDQDFEVVSLASYNMIIVTGTTCTRVENTVQGTMVTMYETNPNGSNRLNINKTLLSVVIMLFVFMNQRVFRYWIKRAYVSLV